MLLLVALGDRGCGLAEATGRPGFQRFDVRLKKVEGSLVVAFRECSVIGVHQRIERLDVIRRGFAPGGVRLGQRVHVVCRLRTVWFGRVPC